jgi:ribosome-associated protein
MVDSLEIARSAAEAADGKKALDIVILDLRDLTSVTDYFVICSATSTTQVDAIADGISSSLAQAGTYPTHIEGKTAATWVLMDYGDVVVHVFDEHTRAYYALERLWIDAPRVPVPYPTSAVQGSSS